MPRLIRHVKNGIVITSYTNPYEIFQGLKVKMYTNSFVSAINSLRWKR